ncbi:Ionotropic receptor 215, partial [Frankliniella occidentalis]
MQLLALRLLGVLGVLTAAAHAALPAVNTGLPAGAQCVSDYLAAALRSPNSTLVIHGDVDLVTRDLAPETPKVIRPPRDEDLNVRLRQTLTTSRTLNLVVKRSGKELLDFLMEVRDAWNFKQVLLWTWASSPHDVLALTQAQPLWMCRVRINLAVSNPNGTTVLYSATEMGCQDKWQDIESEENGRCSPGLLPWPKESLPEPLCLEWQPRRSGKSTTRVTALAPPQALTDVIRPYKKLVENLVASVQPAVELDWVSNNKTSYWQVFASE